MKEPIDVGIQRLQAIVYKINLKTETNQIGGLTSLDHGPLINSGFRTFCHLCRHCTSVLSGKHSAGKVKDIVSMLGLVTKHKEVFPLRKRKTNVDERSMSENTNK